MSTQDQNNILMVYLITNNNNKNGYFTRKYKRTE